MAEGLWPGLKLVECAGVDDWCYLILSIFSLACMLICTLLNHLILATPHLILSPMPSPLFTSLPSHALTILHFHPVHVSDSPTTIDYLCTHMHNYLYITRKSLNFCDCLFVYCVSHHTALYWGQGVHVLCKRPSS